jgi:imidazolonepropionase-like amidohydrolase
VTPRPCRVPLALLAVIALTSCKPPGDGVVALEGATLIDGSGRPPVHDAVIIVQNGHIQSVARVNEVPVPRGARRVSLIGKTVVPGLVDAHAHVERWAIERYVAWGVTTVRDLGASSTDSSIALKNDLNLGSVLGPRMFTSGAMIDGTPPTYPAATAVRSRADVRRAVDQRAVAGADLVKIYTKFTADLLPALVDEASTLRFPIAAHLGKIDALTAARAGVTSLEHMAGVVQAASRDPGPYLRAHDQFLRGWTVEEAGWALLDSASLERVARGLVAARVAIVPTLVLHEMLSRLDNPTLLSRPGMEDVPATATNVRDVARLLRRSNQLLVPGLSLHEEMSLLVAAGLTPVEAITAATRKGAEVLRADSLGALIPGKVADLVVLDANPATDIAATRRIAFVMIRGRIIRPDSLRRTWGR